MQTRPTVTSAARRAQIVEAATRVIAREGLSRASFGRIAGEAGVSSPGMISYHFTDKDELFSVLCERMLGECVASIEAAVTAADDPVAALEAYLTSFVAWQDAHRDAVGALWRLASGWKAPGSDRAFDEAPLLAPLLDVLEQGAREGVLRPTRPDRVARIVLCAVEGFHDVLLDDPDVDADDYLAELVPLVRGGLEVRGGATT